MQTMIKKSLSLSLSLSLALFVKLFVTHFQFNKTYFWVPLTYFNSLIKTKTAKYQYWPLQRLINVLIKISWIIFISLFLYWWSDPKNSNHQLSIECLCQFLLLQLSWAEWTDMLWLKENVLCMTWLFFIFSIMKKKHSVFLVV